MTVKIFNNKLLLALTKADLHKILSEYVTIYSWKIIENNNNNNNEIIVLIYDINQDELLEKYIITHINDNLMITIECYTGIKEINLPFYFALDLFHSIRNNVDIRYTTIYQKTSIDGLKKFHNNIKKMHMQDIITKLRKTGTFAKNIALLDLCCGKGNDMAKWHVMGIRNIVGIDINAGSILEAKHRFLAKNYSSDFNVKFITSDVGTFDDDTNKFLSNYLLGISGKKDISRKFDIVTCNFAIHYLFKHQDNLRIFFALINKYLRVGGYFIGTTLNKELILKLFSKNENKKPYVSPLLEITPKAHFFDESKIYGRRYGIRIGLSGENTYFGKEESNEYLVDFAEMRAVAFKYGLIQIDFANFKMMQHKDLSEDEKLASFLNSKFTFYKQF